MSIVPKDWNKVGPFVAAIFAAGIAWGVSNYQISDLRKDRDQLSQRVRRMEFLIVKMAQKQGIDTSRIED